jgi:hypothetical protein
MIEELADLTTSVMDNKKTPSHEVYHVRNWKGQDGASQRGTWTKVGACWPHKDGKGYDLVFDVPVHAERLVARVREEKPQGTGKES